MIRSMDNPLPLALALLLWSCGDGDTSGPPGGGGGAEEATPPADTGDGDGDAAESTDHGAALDLGSLSLGGFTFELTVLGELTPGEEGAFAVAVTEHPDGVDPAALNLYLWVEDESRTQVSSPSKGMAEEGSFHFHVQPRAGTAPVRAVLRLRHDGMDERGGLPLSGHGHEHPGSPHDGVPAAFQDPEGATAGHLELKLHDDKGDLELWLYQDPDGTQPYDLPLDAVVEVTFLDHDDRVVELRVRNGEQNEDEDGNPNVRESGTHYFLFPGDTGADASWLQGSGFSSIVQVQFTLGEGTFRSDELMLVPHTHADGEAHD